MREFSSDDHYIYYCGQESLRRNRVAITVNKRVSKAVLGCNLKNERMISVHFQGKPFNITVFQVYAQPVMLKKLKLNSSMKTYNPTPVFLPGKSPGWSSPAGYNPWASKESDTTERLPFHFSLSCFGEGNGNPLQCSGLENPRDGGAWRAAIYGVAQSRTRLKQLSSSSSSSIHISPFPWISFPFRSLQSIE